MAGLTDDSTPFRLVETRTTEIEVKLSFDKGRRIKCYQYLTRPQESDHFFMSFYLRPFFATFYTRCPPARQSPNLVSSLSLQYRSLL